MWPFDLEDLVRGLDCIWDNQGGGGGGGGGKEHKMAGEEEVGIDE